METNKQYLSVEDLSIKLNCTPQYTRKLIRDGKIPAEQVGKTWVINPEVLNDNETNYIFDLHGFLNKYSQNNLTVEVYTYF